MEEEMNPKGKTKKILIIIPIILAILVVAYVALIKYEQKQAEQTVTNMFISLQTGEESNSFFTDMVDESLNNLTTSNENKTNESFFKKLSYNVLSTKGNFKNAAVVVEVTNKNMKTVLANYMTKALQLAFASAFSSNELTEEEMNQQLADYLKEQIDSDEIEALTNTVTINLVKDNGKWIFSEENKTEIFSAVLPGFSEFQESLENSLNDGMEE